MNEERKIIGFDSEKEVNFLDGVRGSKRENLAVELETQLAEDFGLVKHIQRYDWVDEKIVDPKSGLKILDDIVAKGNCVEETESWKIREEGLKRDSTKTWVHFSPINKHLGYVENSIDFLRMGDEGKVVWNRVNIKNGLETMKIVRQNLGGEGEINNKMDILRSPVATDLRVVDVIASFQMAEKRNEFDYPLISEVVNKYLSEFVDEFGNKLTRNKELIYRLYSFCHKKLKNEGLRAASLITREDYRDLEMFMHREINGIKMERSYGCAGGTTVAEFGDNYGYKVSENGQITFGYVDKDLYIQCAKCGCYYKKGGKCPLC